MNRSNIDISITSDKNILYNNQDFNSGITINTSGIMYFMVNITSICSGQLTTFDIGNFMATYWSVVKR